MIPTKRLPVAGRTRAAWCGNRSRRTIGLKKLPKPRRRVSKAARTRHWSTGRIRDGRGRSPPPSPPAQEVTVDEAFDSCAVVVADGDGFPAIVIGFCDGDRIALV